MHDIVGIGSAPQVAVFLGRFIKMIFNLFFTTKTVGHGTGHGLAIIWDVITRKHDGRLNFETVLGEDTTFAVRLPIKKESIEK